MKSSKNLLSIAALIYTQVEVTNDGEDNEGAGHMPAGKGHRRAGARTIVADDPQIRPLAHAWLDAYIPDYIHVGALVDLHADRACAARWLCKRCFYFHASVDARFACGVAQDDMRHMR